MKTSWKSKILIYSRIMNVLFCKESKSFIKIMIFSKFSQKIYFYLIVASLYLIRSKLKIFIHSFILCRLPCPNEWFQFKLFWRKCNEKVASSNLIISFRCWNPVEYIQKLIISFLTVPLDEIDYGVRHIKLCKIQNQPYAGVLQDRFLKEFR